MLFLSCMTEQASAQQPGFWDRNIAPVVDFFDPTLERLDAGLTGAGVFNTFTEGAQALTTVAPDVAEWAADVGGATPWVGGALDVLGFGKGLVDMGGALHSADGKGLHDDDFYEGAGAVINNGASLGLTGLGLAVGAGMIGTGGLVGSIFGPLGTAVGGSAGATGAAATMAGIEFANTALGLATAGIDAVGLAAWAAGGEDAKFSTDSMIGGMIRGTMGDESLGWDVGASTSAALGGGLGADIVGGVVGTGANLLASPLNVADTVIGGGVNFFADLADNDSDESTAWQDFKTSINPFAGMY